MKHLKLALLTLLIALSGCSSNPPADEQVIADSPTNPKVSQRIITDKQEQVTPGDPKFRPVRSYGKESLMIPSGSLFRPERAIGLYQPTSLYYVGDMILVRLEEKTSADKSLRFKTDKKGVFELQPVTLNAGPIQIGGNDLNAEYEQANDFDSSAQTKQKNSLKGDITVYVTDIMPNGNLLIAGEKWLTLNTGEEYIRFSGEVRVGDIAKDNSISSVKVGNARIEYSGTGKQQDNQKASFIGKLFGLLE